jgi:subtilase family serine protease
MFRSRRTVVTLVVLSALAAAAGAATASVPTAPTVVRIAGNVLPSLSKLASVPAPANRVLSIGVSLQHPDAAAEQALLTSLYTPGSAQYGKFPTFEQVAQRFGVPRSRTAHVVATLRAAGLTVATADAMGDYVSATGTVAQVEKAFHVAERLYTLSNGLRFLANTTGPLVSVADKVTTVVGLNTLQHYTLPSHRSKVAQDTCVGGICTGNTTPQDLWSVYGQPAKRTGQGVTMAVIGEGNPKNLTGYLRRHEATYRLPATKVTVKCVQGSCGNDTSGDGEWQIDTQASAGMAPGNAGLTLYFAKTILDGDLNNAFVAWAHDSKGPKLASASLGECEASPINGVFTGPLNAVNGNTSGSTLAVVAFGNGEQLAVDPLLRTAVMTGKTLFASTGDTGSSCPLLYLPVISAGNGVLNQVLPEQNYPAVSAHAVAVGGTVLYTNNNGTGAGTSYKPGKPATRAAEYAWAFGGGGASLYISAPPWQARVSGNVQPCLTAPTSVCRGVPDVSAQSGDVLTNGYSVVGSTGFTSGGGTSLSSPLWMGMWARVQGAAGHNLGFAAPLLYRAASTPSGYAASFNDVTLGTNGLHVATPGWDYTTGLGTPRVSGLIKTLTGHS